jgi:5-methylthioadenosine/S-adenosylhomocysteine deaminase
VSLAVTGVRLGEATVGLRAVDGRIAALGPDVTAEPGDEVVDGSGSAVLPGFVNGHTHAAMTLFRGYAGDLPLMQWLEDHIWPAEAKLTEDDVYWGTRLACVEMIRTGTVHFWDMYWQPQAAARAVTDAGLRATVGGPLIDALDPATSAPMRQSTMRLIDELDGTDARVAASITPHSIYMVSEETLAWVAETSATRDVPVQLHFLEIEDEITGLAERTGERPAAYLERIGLLTPRTVLAHGCWLADDDLDLIATGGTTIVTNPVSNLKLAVGRVFPYAAARARGIPVGIGTDGASSNNGLDLLQDLKVLALLQKHEQRDPAALPAQEALEVATAALAPMLGTTRLEVGAPADFLLIRQNAPELAPSNLIANLVYAASGAVVDTTVVAGDVLMHGGVIEGADEVVAKAREAAARLGVC